MKHKFEISKLSRDELIHWYSTIKPIVEHDTYLRELTPDELTYSSYTWLSEPSDYGEKVDFSKLSVLEDRKMLHVCSFYGFFKPSVAEVICQIPPSKRPRVVAFEILEAAIGMNSIFKPELDAGFHVSIVRLYQAKKPLLEPAKQVKKYPTEDSKAPIGISEKVFHELFMF